jgi:hypothetical protein
VHAGSAGGAVAAARAAHALPPGTPTSPDTAAQATAVTEPPEAPQILLRKFTSTCSLAAVSGSSQRHEEQWLHFLVSIAGDGQVERR